MRLIDADALVDDGLRFQDGYDYNGIMMVRLGNVTKSIRNAPTIDAVPVVRCRECRWHEDEQPGMVYCPATVGGWVEDDWFCKGGERKDGAE